MVDEITIDQIQKMFQDKKLSVKELANEYLSRISLFDQGADKLNSILEINPDIITIAEELDRKYECRNV